MENKINVAELLKDFPKGMELDCAIFENLEFDHVDKDSKYPIVCRIELEGGHYNTQTFTKYGCYTNDKFSKCAIFPKGKTTWEGFVPPCKFKDGDILIHGDCTFIYNGFENNMNYGTYVIIDCDGAFAINALTKKYGTRFATEEEKAKLFKAIKGNGYRWDTETKTLEKLVEPRFKVGDRIRHKTHIRQGNVVTEIKDTHYILDDELALPFISQDEYELVPNKFDITTLKPFDKVLVRDHNDSLWRADFYSHYEDNQHYSHVCTGDGYHQCIPYNEETANLVGTTNDCPDKYKTWKDEQ